MMRAEVQIDAGFCEDTAVVSTEGGDVGEE